MVKIAAFFFRKPRFLLFPFGTVIISLFRSDRYTVWLLELGIRRVILVFFLQRNGADTSACSFDGLFVVNVGETQTELHSLVLTLQKQSNCLDKGHHSLQLTSYSPIVLLVYNKQ